MTSLSTKNITVANTNSAINQIKTIANSYLAQDNSKISKKELSKLKKEILKELANIKSGKQLSKRVLVVLIDNIKKYVSDSKSLIQTNVGPIFSSKVQEDFSNFNSDMTELAKAVQDGSVENKDGVKELLVKLQNFQKNVKSDSIPSAGHEDDADIGKLLSELNDVISQYTKGLVLIVKDISIISSKIYTISSLSASAAGNAEVERGTGQMIGAGFAVLIGAIGCYGIGKSTVWANRSSKIEDSLEKTKDAEAAAAKLDATAEQQNPGSTINGTAEEEQVEARMANLATGEKPEATATAKGKNPPVNGEGRSLDAQFENASSKPAATNKEDEEAWKKKTSKECQTKQQMWSQIVQQTTMGANLVNAGVTGYYSLTVGQLTAMGQKAQAQAKFTETVENQAKTIVQNISSGVETIARTMEASNGLFIARGRAGAA